jgi:hypothetical protein
MNERPEIMRREEKILVPWRGHWRAGSANKQSLLCSPGGEVIILAPSDAELFHDASV